MAMAEVKKIIERARKDKDFRKTLLDNPQEAIKDYSLTEEEKTKFVNIKQEKILSLKNNLDRRHSKDGSSATSDDEWWVDSVID